MSSTIRSKWKCIATGSIMANLLMGGVMLGYGWHKMDGHRPPPPPQSKALEALSPERRAEFDAVMGQMKKDSEGLREQMREAREEGLKILATEPFDEAAYQAAMDKVHQLRSARKEKMAETVKEMARRWPATERAALAELLRRPPQRECEERPAPPPPHGERPEPTSL